MKNSDIVIYITLFFVICTQLWIITTTSQMKVRVDVIERTRFTEKDGLQLMNECTSQILNLKSQLIHHEAYVNELIFIFLEKLDDTTAKEFLKSHKKLKQEMFNEHTKQ